MNEDQAACLMLACIFLKRQQRGHVHDDGASPRHNRSRSRSRNNDCHRRRIPVEDMLETKRVDGDDPALDDRHRPA